jgi:hypothetical protein
MITSFPTGDIVPNFASPYRKVPYFGIWADETADQYGKRDAMAVLADAAGCCFDDDVRQRPELGRALAYLARETSRAVYVNRFRKALRRAEPGHPIQGGRRCLQGSGPAYWLIPATTPQRRYRMRQ